MPSAVPAQVGTKLCLKAMVGASVESELRPLENPGAKNIHCSAFFFQDVFTCPIIQSKVKTNKKTQKSKTIMLWHLGGIPWALRGKRATAYYFIEVNGPQRKSRSTNGEVPGSSNKIRRCTRLENRDPRLVALCLSKIRKSPVGKVKAIGVEEINETLDFLRKLIEGACVLDT